MIRSAPIKTARRPAQSIHRASSWIDGCSCEHEIGATSPHRRRRRVSADLRTAHDDRHSRRSRTGCRSDLSADGVGVGFHLRCRAHQRGTARWLCRLVDRTGKPVPLYSGALRIIRYAREHDVPLFGTCGGYQHVVLEYARNVLGFTEAANAEYDPYASELFITALECSLAGRTMTVTVRAGTTAARLYRSAKTTEQYYCNFGLNPDHLPALTAAGLVVSGTDQDGEPRILELAHLRYFLATLFVPRHPAHLTRRTP